MNVFLNLNCMDCQFGLPTLPDDFFDLGFLDPPYGIGEDGGRKRYGYARQKNGSVSRIKGTFHQKKSWDIKPPGPEYFYEVNRVCKNIIVWGVNNFPHVEWPSSGRIVWDKLNTANYSDAEIAYVSMSRKVTVIPFLWNGMQQAGSVASGRIQLGNKKQNVKKIHPCQKPVQIYRSILNQFAKPGFRILDSHAGSGSSLIAFEEMGFSYVAFELDPDYYQDAAKRISQFRSRARLFQPQEIRQTFIQKKLFEE